MGSTVRVSAFISLPDHLHRATGDGGILTNPVVDGIDWVARVVDPTLATRRSWFRSDLNRLSFSPDGVAVQLLSPPIFQTATIGVDFTTTSTVFVDIGLNITPAATRQRGIVILQADRGNSVAQNTKLQVTNTTNLKYSSGGVNNELDTGHVGDSISVMGTICKAQALVSAASTATVFAAGTTLLTVEW